MGLLSSGTPLRWEASARLRARVAADGVAQFLAVFRAARGFRNNELKWGDEVEYMLVRMDHDAEVALLSLDAPALIAELQRHEHATPAGSSVPVLWRPEYANWMIEGTPGLPYRCYAADLALVERNMALRRNEIANLLGPKDAVMTLTAFPRTGCGVYTHPPTLPFGPVARSLFTSDVVINPHPRFGTLTRNIRTRRGRKVDIRVPLFVDSATVRPQPLVPNEREHLALLDEAAQAAAVTDADAAGDCAVDSDAADTAYMSVEEGLKTTVGDNIVMDSAAFGMGCCCLQVTIQGRDLGESRYLYDQLAVMAPLMLALTAATPAVRGLLADADARWDIIAAAMDDRTEEEAESGRVPKSRYSSIDCFISCRDNVKAETYNDLPVPIHQETYDRLIAGGVDHMLAKHVAHLFIREPLVIYEESVEQDNSSSMDHFENIQSTNWNTVRFKPPPPNTDIGWRTEFRSMEVGLTDFENAAFSVFIVILSRVILAFNLNFYMPMSAVDENMQTAHLRDAVTHESFLFRKNVFKSSDGSGFLCSCGHIHNASLVGGQSEFEDIEKFCGHSDKDSSSSGSDSDSDPHEAMTLNEIFNGKPLCRDGRPAGFAFPGLIPLMRGYLDSLKIDAQTRARLLTYIDFVSERASGKLCTTAAFMRKFIMEHQHYEHDSVVTEEICYDLMITCQGITKGEIHAPELLGRFQAERISGDVVTSQGMMARMQKTLSGPEAGLLHGSSMPKGALEKAINRIAQMRLDETRCCGC